MLFLASALSSLLLSGSRDVVVFVSAASEPSRYAVTYKARFKWILGKSCFGSKAALYASCRSGGTLSYVASSHDTVGFVRLDDSSAAFGENTCKDYAECTKVFVTDEQNDDVYGELYFTCSGDDRGQTGAFVTYSDGEPSTCTKNIWGGTYGYHVVQLGVLCGDDGEAVGGDVEFDFLSQYMECRDGFFEVFNGKYSCAAGKSCGGSGCTIEYNYNATVASDPNRFSSDCFDVADQLPVGAIEPVQASMPAPVPRGDYTVRYRVLWTADTERGTAFEYYCDVTPPVIRIACLDGADLELVDVLYPEVNCTSVDDSTAECHETCGDREKCTHYWTEDKKDWRYSGMTFDCHAEDRLPAAKATYTSTNYSIEGCWSSSNYYFVDHLIQIGTYCGDRFSGDYYYGDDFVECGMDADGFKLSTETDGFECYSLAGPLVGTDFTTPDVTVFTEPSRISKREECFSFDAAPTASPSPTVVAPTKEPTKATELRDNGETSSGKREGANLLASLACFVLIYFVRS